MSDIVGTNNFTQYGREDKNQVNRKEFLKGIWSERGVHSSEIKKTWNKSKNWLNLLTTMEKKERKEIVLAYLDINAYRDAETVLEAYEKLDPYIQYVSYRALVDFFEKNKVVQDAISAVGKTKPENRLLVSQLGWDILNWEQKMFKQQSCPKMFYTPARLVLYTVECEDDNHRADCIQYHADGENSWADSGAIIGVGRKEFYSDQVEMRNLKLKLWTTLFTKLMKEYPYEEAINIVTRINWEHPAIYTRPDLVELLEITKKEQAFIAKFFNIYDVEVLESGAVITSMKDEYDESVHEYV